MKILIIDTYYLNFLKTIKRKHPEISHQDYHKQLKLLLSQRFGTSDFYSYNLKMLGHTAIDAIINDEPLMRTWAKEHHFNITESNFFSHLQMRSYLHRFLGRPTWIQEITLAQIKDAKPDVVYLQDLSVLNPSTLIEIKKYCKLLVGQIASPLPPFHQLTPFDLIISSFPHFVSKFQKVGINSAYLPLAFDPRILKEIDTKNKLRKYDISFVGSFTYYHRSGTKTLETIAKHFPIHIWGQGLNIFSKESLTKNYHGQAWGVDMYSIFAQTKIVINRHIDVAKNYANNMRMYEATGMGALLVTDEKKNLHSLFRPGKEVITYKGTADLIDKLKYYLYHEKERIKIAEAGHKHTLLKHNYLNRMKELVGILNQYL